MKSRIFALTVLCALSSIAQAQNYPAKTVRITVPFAPGGTLETFGELLKREVTEWGEVVKAANIKSD